MSETKILWAMTLDGVIGSQTYGAWVSMSEAVETLREHYPDAMAILNARNNSLVWKLEGVELV
jgi:hypothetical protein